LGFCVRGDMRLLVYEYMPNGSLESHIFSERSTSSLVLLLGPLLPDRTWHRKGPGLS
jgi:hypothetical protein